MEDTNPYILDIESSGLLSDMLDFSSFPYKLRPDASLWCVVIRNMKTQEVISRVMGDITPEWMKESLKDATHIIGHNIIKFDFIALKLFGVLDYRIGYPGEYDTVFGRNVVIVDSLILSRLLNPDRYEGHSLVSWGRRVKNLKIGFRGQCIAAGIIDEKAPKGAEFLQYSDLMLEYCIGDTSTNADTFKALTREMGEYTGWAKAIKMENKLADLAVRRESLGFWFDKDLAVKCIEDLTQKMQTLAATVNPLLPPKPMTKGELDGFTPPKTQFKKIAAKKRQPVSEVPSANMVRFAEKVGGKILINEEDRYFLEYKNQKFELPYTLPLETHAKASIDNLDHVKMHLLSLGWNPTEWAERDLTKDAKKQNISFEKRVSALERWVKDTFEGKYKEQRLEIVGIKDREVLLEKFKRRLEEDKPVRVPTAPKVRVGVEKELCPHLTSLGEQVAFAGDFALFLTYRHRKSCIAGGDVEDMDFDSEVPNTGYLSMYREVDGRVATPAIEIGAISNRFKHVGVANVPRSSSTYGKEMRSLFGCGEGAVQFGFDYSSLENRVQGGYVKKYPGGEELAESLMADKPNDLHTINSIKLGISRTDCKSVNYMILYGGQPPKIVKMLGVSLERAKEIYNDFWDAVPALRQLKENVEKFWESNGKTYIPAIDGRKINIRSKHSLLNFLFQSCGAICAKYVTVFIAQELEEKGYCIDPFIAEPDVCEMISYHDESQQRVKPELIAFKTFVSKEDAEYFVANWVGGQLSAISEGKTWYVALPNAVSLALTSATKRVEELLKLDFTLGFEWIVNKDWAGCH